MAMSDLLNISSLMDDAKCFAFVREKRWPDGARCPGCDSGFCCNLRRRARQGLNA